MKKHFLIFTTLTLLTACGGGTNNNNNSNNSNNNTNDSNTNIKNKNNKLVKTGISNNSIVLFVVSAILLGSLTIRKKIKK